MNVSWRAVVFVAVLAVCGFLGFSIQLLLATPLALVAAASLRRLRAGVERAVPAAPGCWTGHWAVRLTRAHHVVADQVSRWWFALVAYLLEHLYGIRLRAFLETGTVNPRGGGVPSRRPLVTEADWGAIRPPPAGHVTIVLSNHRTRIDWLLLWMFFARTHGMLSGLKIALKDSLRSVPIFGWAMQHYRFLFLARQKETDERRIDTLIKHFVVTQDAVTLLFFPEGTDLSESNVAKSRAFAVQTGKPQYTYVLNPRTTGLVSLLACCDANGLRVHDVWDLTMGYREHTSGVRTSEGSILSAKMPHELHILCRRFTLPEIHADFGSVANFVETRFAQKERDLAAFYAHPHNRECFDGTPVTTTHSARPTEPAEKDASSGGYGTASSAAVPLLWATVTVGFWQTVWVLSGVGGCVALTVVAVAAGFVVSSKRFGGFDAAVWGL